MRKAWSVSLHELGRPQEGSRSLPPSMAVRVHGWWHGPADRIGALQAARLHARTVRKAMAGQPCAAIAQSRCMQHRHVIPAPAQAQPGGPTGLKRRQMQRDSAKPLLSMSHASAMRPCRPAMRKSVSICSAKAAAQRPARSASCEGPWAPMSELALQFTHARSAWRTAALRGAAARIGPCCHRPRCAQRCGTCTPP